VTDLSSLTKVEASKFLAQARAKTCVRFQTNAAGKINYKDTAKSSRLSRFRLLIASTLASLVPGNIALANEPPPPQNEGNTDYNEADECEFMGELSPFTIDIPEPKKAKQSFHQRKNYQNNQPRKNNSAD
jgi:hypothetical protein